MKNKKVLIAVIVIVLVVVIGVGVFFLIRNDNTNNEKANDNTMENVMEKPTGGREKLPDGPEPDNPDGTRPPEDPLGRQGFERPDDPGTGNVTPPELDSEGRPVDPPPENQVNTNSVEPEAKP